MSAAVDELEHQTATPTMSRRAAETLVERGHERLEQRRGVRDRGCRPPGARSARRGSRAPTPGCPPRPRRARRRRSGASLSSTTRPVLRTDALIVSRSSGATVRRSMTSTEMPSAATASAASSAWRTVNEYVTSVTSSPSRATRPSRTGSAAIGSVDLAAHRRQALVHQEDHRDRRRAAPVTSSPPASAGVAGVATTSPGVAANQDSTLFVCCAANRPTPVASRG